MTQLKQTKERLIFPLDLPSFEEANRYVRLLSDHVGMFKIGLELFIRSGPDIIRTVASAGGAGVFLDLKLHDIPEIVYRAVSGIADLDVAFTTVHCGESAKSLLAAVKGGGGKVHILGVTVLTSVSSEDLHQSGYAEPFCSDLSGLVLKKAVMAKHAGCDGVVCSGLEVKMIKEHLGKSFVAVTPGIRPSWDDIKPDDQARIVTPAQAIQNGADYVVIGRPIRDAGNPVEAARRIIGEIEEALGRIDA